MCIMALQEIPAWDSADGCEYAGRTYKVFKEMGSECGFILPAAWALRVVHLASGRDWAVVLTGPLLYCSLHYLPWDPERAAEALNGLTAAILYVKHNINDMVTVVIGADLNTTLMQDDEGLVGPYVMERPRSHSVIQIQRVLSFLDEHGTMACNTHTPTDYHQLFTRSSGGKDSQLDYILHTDDLVGTASAHSISRAPFTQSDHRPVVASLRLVNDQNLEPMRHELKAVSWVGWRPSDEGELLRYKQEALALTTTTDIRSMQEGMVQIASSIDFDTAASRRRVYKQGENTSIKAARQRVRPYLQSGDAYSSAGRNAVHDLRIAKRKRKRCRAQRGLLAMAKGSNLKPAKTPQKLLIGGLLTADRDIWRSYGVTFGSARFGDPENDFSVQDARMAKLRAWQSAQRLDGHPRLGIDCFDVLVARAEMKDGKCSGGDPLVSECFKHLPFAVVVHVWRTFDTYHGQIGEQEPPSWDTVGFVGLNKKTGANQFVDFRWLAKLAALFRWYCRSWKHRLKLSDTINNFQTTGFVKGCSSEDVVVLVKESIRKRRDDGGSMVIIAGDILTAFDAMKHGVIDGAFDSNLDVDTRIAVMKQYYRKQAFLTIPGAGNSDSFPYVRGGWQGGINTPDQFNQVLRRHLEDIILGWETRGLGVTFGGKLIANHIFFADNGFILADKLEDGMLMMQQLTDRLYKIGFEWKPSSLQLMMVGADADQTIDRSLQLPHATSVKICQVSQMEVLGTLIDHEGSHRESVHFRLLQAERSFQKHRQVLCGRGSPGQKLAAWESTVSTSATFAAGVTPLTRELAHDVNAWENRHLRFVLRLRPWEAEMQQENGYTVFLQRSARYIDYLRGLCNRPSLVHLMLRAYFREAWKEKVRADRDGRNRTLELREYRNARWWKDILAIPFHARKYHGWVHARPGAPLRQWEDLMVEMCGVDWRTLRDSSNSKREWMKQADDIINILCSLWDLPSLSKKASKPSPPDMFMHKSLGEWPDRELDHPADSAWEDAGKRFLFVMDSQVVQQVCCGHAALTQEKYRCVFRRIVVKLVSFLTQGLAPPRSIDDPVQWRPREFNTRADYLCNKALDSKSSYSHAEESCQLEMYKTIGANWMAYSDGGGRGDGWSAFAWIVYAVVPSGEWVAGSQKTSSHWHRFTVAFGYEIVKGDYSSFVTELWGLERAVSVLHDLIGKPAS